MYGVVRADEAAGASPKLLLPICLSWVVEEDDGHAPGVFARYGSNWRSCQAESRLPQAPTVTRPPAAETQRLPHPRTVRLQEIGDARALHLKVVAEAKSFEKGRV